MQKNIVWTLVQGIVKIWGLATGLKGEEKKLANGEKENGPTMWPANHFLSSLEYKTNLRLFFRAAQI